MELYAIAALLIALFTLVSGRTHRSPNGAVQNGGGMLTPDSIWQAIVCLCVLVVAVLFYKGMKAGHQKEKGSAPASSGKPQRSQLSMIQYTELFGSFMNLTWAQKVAMEVLCKGYARDEATLVYVLEKKGFGSGQELMERIVKPVCASRLVDYGKLGEVAPKQSCLVLLR